MRNRSGIRAVGTRPAASTGTTPTTTPTTTGTTTGMPTRMPTRSRPDVEVATADDESAEVRMAETARCITGALEDGTIFTGLIADLASRVTNGGLLFTGTLSRTGSAADAEPFSKVVSCSRVRVDQAGRVLTLDLGSVVPGAAGPVVNLEPVRVDVTAEPNHSNLPGNLLNWLAVLLETEGPPQGISALLNRILSRSGLGC